MGGAWGGFLKIRSSQPGRAWALALVGDFRKASVNYFMDLLRGGVMVYQLFLNYIFDVLYFCVFVGGGGGCISHQPSGLHSDLLAEIGRLC